MKKKKILFILIPNFCMIFFVSCKIISKVPETKKINDYTNNPKKNIADDNLIKPEKEKKINIPDGFENKIIAEKELKIPETEVPKKINKPKTSIVPKNPKTNKTPTNPILIKKLELPSDAQNNAESFAQLKNDLEKLPNVLYVTTSKQQLTPLTLIYNAKNDYKNLSYQSLVDPIEFNEKKYNLKLDFSDAISANSEKSPIERVKIIFTLKENPKISSTKEVVVFYEKTSENFITVTKKLPENFNEIFPSFLAFALTNSSNDDSILSPFFNDLDFIVKGRNFGLGLKDSFFEIKSKNPQSDEEKYSFNVVGAVPDDQNGKLKLKLQLWRIDKEEKWNSLGSEKEIEFSGMAKNDNLDYKIETATNNLELELMKKEINKKLKMWQNVSEFTKNDFLKILLKHLYIRVKMKKNGEKFLKITESVVNKNWIVFPQIQYVDLDSKNLIKNLELKKEGENRISWKFKFQTSLLAQNQTLTSQNRDFLPGDTKTYEFNGFFDLNNRQMK
ncbi:LppA-related lipoprotein [Mycoplasma sp. 'Moose RK']|uniref:LppA-related lipoprotein n=1 Tax=Mycoplasma sp. 'Moose RK' TaxID=2780095 RepID=UPI0018C351CA|nr:hypothetical protein [Mycoplasma sp. 'Moose RK']MBG0730619.1 hypothetical protein [Mycoplasma sp. 'Moose RK']